MAERQELVDRLRDLTKGFDKAAKESPLSSERLLLTGHLKACRDAADQIESDQHLRAAVEGLVLAVGAEACRLRAEAVDLRRDFLPRAADDGVYAADRLDAALKQAKEALG